MERDETRAEAQAPSVEPVFVVLERDPLVAEDIMGSLTAMGPCRVVHARDSDGLLSALVSERGISAAFLDIPFQKVVEIGLDEKLNDHGARIVLTVGEDDRPMALARGWGMLIRPFTEKMIRDVVLPGPV